MNKSKLQKYQRLLEELRDRLRTEMNDMVAKSAEHLRTEGDVPADRDAEGYGEELTLIRNDASCSARPSRRWSGSSRACSAPASSATSELMRPGSTPFLTRRCASTAQRKSPEKRSKKKTRRRDLRDRPVGCEESCCLADQRRNIFIPLKEDPVWSPSPAVLGRL